MVPTVLPQAMFSSPFTTTILIFLCRWSMKCEVVLAARVDNTVNLGMVALAVEVELQLPGV